MACRLNGDGKNFDKAADNLARTAQVQISGETFRCSWRPRAAGAASAEGGTSCRSIGRRAIAKRRAAGTRIYFGSDGVMVPLVTDVEKKKRRQKIKAKRRRRGKKAKPLPPRKVGTDQKYKEFKIVAFYDETQEHRLVAGTKGDCQVAGRLMRREAAASIWMWRTRRSATSMARRGSAIKSSDRVCLWMRWVWISITWRARSQSAAGNLR